MISSRTSRCKKSLGHIPDQCSTASLPLKIGRCSHLPTFHFQGRTVKPWGCKQLLSQKCKLSSFPEQHECCGCLTPHRSQIGCHLFKWTCRWRWVGHPHSLEATFLLGENFGCQEHFENFMLAFQMCDHLFKAPIAGLYRWSNLDFLQPGPKDGVLPMKPHEMNRFGTDDKPDVPFNILHIKHHKASSKKECND